MLDAGGGLASISVPTAVNVTVTPFAVTAGTNAPIAFSATKQVQSQAAQVAVVLTDVDGNQSSCV